MGGALAVGMTGQAVEQRLHDQLRICPAGRLQNALDAGDTELLAPSVLGVKHTIGDEQQPIADGHAPPHALVVRAEAGSKWHVHRHAGRCIADDVEGVLVSAVADPGPAAEKGVRPGDVIVEVGQEPVRTPAEVEAQIAKAADAGRKSVLFLIHTNGDLRFVPLSLAEKG